MMNEVDFETALAKVQDLGFWEEVNFTPGGCWEWPVPLKAKYPYGRAYIDGAMRPAHRVGYSLMEGSIPEGMVIDHRCRNTRCVNPAHLEPVTTAENNRRSITATKTHCVRGHAFDEKNTRHVPGGGRRCRACHNQINKLPSVWTRKKLGVRVEDVKL